MQFAYRAFKARNTHTHTQSHITCSLLLHRNNGYLNAPECYVLLTSSVLLGPLLLSASQASGCECLETDIMWNMFNSAQRYVTVCTTAPWHHIQSVLFVSDNMSYSREKKINHLRATLRLKWECLKSVQRSLWNCEIFWVLILTEYLFQNSFMSGIFKEGWIPSILLLWGYFSEHQM